MKCPNCGGEMPFPSMQPKEMRLQCFGCGEYFRIVPWQKELQNRIRKFERLMKDRLNLDCT